jgi:hypothetical protein
VEDADITCLCASPGNVLLGDSKGTIRILSKSWNVVMSFPAYERGRVTHMKRFKNNSTLITIGVPPSFIWTVPDDEDTALADAVLKIWMLDKHDKKTKGPQLLTTITINTPSPPFPVTPVLSHNPDVCRSPHSPPSKAWDK